MIKKDKSGYKVVSEKGKIGDYQAGNNAWNAERLDAAKQSWEGRKEGKRRERELRSVVARIDPVIAVAGDAEIPGCVPLIPDRPGGSALNHSDRDGDHE